METLNKTLKLLPGELVSFQGAVFRIVRLLDLYTLLAKNLDNKELQRLNIRELKSVEENIMVSDEKSNARELSEIKDEDWAKAQLRYSIILPVLNDRGNGDLVKLLSKENKIDASTIYRWLEKYETTGLISSLVKEVSTGGKGKGRLPEEIEAIIEASLAEIYLSKQRNPVSKVCLDVIKKCKNANYKPPSSATIRRRILSISEEDRLALRYDRSIATAKFKPHEGKFPGADYPLSVIQIDHTKVDVILVDEIYRKPIGRPWITFAIDVFSRCITGFYISFDPPGALGTGMCIANSIMPKEMWLHDMEINGDWPVYGFPQTIMMDNAKEFHGNMLKRACEEHGINIQFRPVAKPHYGGHIERLIGTVMKEMHTLPGTTFSNIKERGYYESEQKAALTLHELERWLMTFIVDVYHKRIHKSIRVTPLHKFEQGILGVDGNLGVGLIKPDLNEQKLRLDFMPYMERTIQEYGVVIDHIYYYHDILKKWIHSYNEGLIKSKTKRLFIFKRDPRDISQLYFYDPELKDYFAIPYRDISHPPITIWEHKAAIKRLEDEGKLTVDESAIFGAYERMQEIQDSAVDKKRVAHRISKVGRKNSSINKSVSKEFVMPNLESFDSEKNTGNKIIKPFEEIDDNDTFE
jgi:putative transposase